MTFSLSNIMRTVHKDTSWLIPIGKHVWGVNSSEVNDGERTMQTGIPVGRVSFAALVYRRRVRGRELVKVNGHREEGTLARALMSSHRAPLTFETPRQLENTTAHDAKFSKARLHLQEPLSTR